MKAQRKILHLAALIFISLLTNISFSQPHTEWIQRYNSSGNYNEDLIDMVLDKYGNVYVTGNTGSPSDIVTIKYSSAGNLQWVKIYNGPANRDDHAVKIAVDDSGFVYVVGETFNYIDFNNYLTIKYSSLGNTVWIKELNSGDSTTEVPNDMVLDDSSNIYITGSGGICGLCPADYITVKYDRNGNLKWKRFFHGDGDVTNTGWTLAVDNSNRIIVSGISADINNSYYNATLLYNSNGELIHVINIDSAEVRRLDIDNSNNFYIGGSRNSRESPINTDIFLNKYDSSGILIWNRLYGSNNSTINRNDYLSWMFLDRNKKNMYLTGLSDLNNQNGWDFLLLKFNSSGDSVWKRGYSPVDNSDNQSTHLTIDRLDNIYITGSADFNTPYYRFLTVKYDSSGNFKWSASYSNILFFNHYSKRILVDSSSNVFVGGTSYSQESSSNDIVVIKYSQMTGIENGSGLIPNQFKLFQNYPNPFNPSTSINYQLPVYSHVELIIRDLLGKEIAVLINENQKAGSYNMIWNASEFASGVYFYNLEIDGKIVGTKRMLLLK